MMLANLLPARWRKPNNASKKPTGRIVVAHWDRENIYFLVSSTKNKQLHAQSFGSLSYAEYPSPFAALANHLSQSNLSVHQLAVLLSRPELEQVTLSLPPSTEEELPTIVSNAIEQQLGESETPPTVDFYRLVTNRRTPESMIDVQAFALTQKTMDTLQQEAEQAGFKLISIGSRQLAAVALLQNLGNSKPCMNILVQLYPGEIELSLCEEDQPHILRSIRVNQDESSTWSELIKREVGRCITLLPPEVEELPQNWIVVCSNEEARMVANSLEESAECTVARFEPFQGWIVDHRSLEAPVDSLVEPRTNEPPKTTIGQFPLPSGALVGASWEIGNNKPRVNLISPKRPPIPPNPLVKPMLWSAVGLTAFSITGYTFLTDVWSLQDEVNQLQNQVTDSGKLASKMQEKSDQTIFVENWLSDQVNWLDVLNEISMRMPDGQDATVGRLSANANAKQGTLDLSVQVIDPEKITQLESKLRSVKYSVTSKRISQSPEASEYPWRFETRILFDIEPKDWRTFAPADSDSPSTNISSAKTSDGTGRKTDTETHRNAEVQP